MDYALRKGLLVPKRRMLNPKRSWLPHAYIIVSRHRAFQPAHFPLAPQHTSVFGYIQGNFHENGAPSVNTCAVTLGAAIGTGQLACVSFGFANSTGVIDVVTCADDQGNSYTSSDSIFVGGGVGYQWNTFYKEGLSNGPQTVTGTSVNNPHSFMAIFVDVYSGVSISAAIDGHTGQFQSVNNGTDAVTSGPITTTINGDLVYGSCVCIDSQGISSAGTGFTIRQNNVDTSFSTEDLTQTTAGSIAATFTGVSPIARSYMTTVMAFKPSAPTTVLQVISNPQDDSWARTTMTAY